MKSSLIALLILLNVSCSEIEALSALQSTEQLEVEREEPLVAICVEPISPFQPNVTQSQRDQVLERSIVGLGINFEDKVGEGGDQDFNDVMLCLEGEFEEEVTKIVAASDQVVMASSSSLADCHHDVEIIVKHEDGNIAFETSFKSDSDVIKTLSILKGDSLEIVMKPDTSPTSAFCESKVKRSALDKNSARIVSGTCQYKADH
ncbi:MAG: hypothetical protein EOP10_32715 [Proteobacteria bacterium]|nr:MAG: hypothetical protein EOP10_32715 [Pseudomonadota bacterium]